MAYALFSDKFLQAMQQPDVCMVYAVEIEFPSGTSRAHSGVGAIVVDGNTFLGVGNLGEIGMVKSVNTTSPSEVTIALSGLDPSVIATGLNDRVVGRNARILAVVFDDVSGQALAADLLFDGFISSTAMSAGENNAYTVTVSNVFERWKRGLPHRYTDSSHQRRHSGDHIFRYCAQMAERSIFWGSKQDAPAFVYK